MPPKRSKAPLAAAPARRSRAKPAQLTPEARRNLHELEVHHVELALQNEELQRARRELEVALDRYTELFDFAPMGYAMIAADDTIAQINHTGARVLGRVRANLVGTRFGLLVSAPDVASFDALLASARASAEQVVGELRLRTGDTTMIDAHVFATALPRRDESVLLAFEDVTQRKAAAEQLAATEQALREANRRKDDFLAMLSHELRNPLAPIISSLFVLSRAEPGSAYARSAHDIIGRQVNHLSRLIDELLDMTRISRGKIQLRREQVELGALVRSTVGDLRAGFEEHEIRLELKLQDEPLWVDGDAVRLVQVLSNLLRNAEKFTPARGSTIVSLRREDTRAVLRVRDSGTGIASEVLPYLFEPFAQAPQNIDRSEGGLGLGLAMVRGLVELHGGTVHITSPGLGRGTEITVELPLVGAGPVASPSRATVPGQRRRVLVIDDNRATAASLRDALALLGHDVRIAFDGATGVAVARDFGPEVLMCDLALPDMNGYQIARTFRAEPRLRDVFLIAVTGSAQDQDIERARAAGFDRHVAKPASLETLVRLLAEAPALVAAASG